MTADSDNGDNPSSLRVPAEWEPQQCLWLAWPHNLETWPGSANNPGLANNTARFNKIPPFYARWIQLICESTPVRILASNESAKTCEQLVGGFSNVEIIDIPTNDCWIRDYGPTFVVHKNDPTIRGVNWNYNAWGGKYAPWDLDDAAAQKICEAENIPCVDGALCLEGGSLEFDGHGRVLTTPDCLVTESRNPGLTADDVSRELHQRLGVTEIVWIDGGGLEGDDTDGHIDQLARFTDRENVVVSVTNDPSDFNRLALEKNYQQLKLWAGTTSPSVQVHRMPIPPARMIDGRRVPESYCNFLRLGPERLLVPTYGVLADDYAIGLLTELTGAEVTGLDCRDLVWGLGALHCASRDQPA